MWKRALLGVLAMFALLLVSDRAVSGNPPASGTVRLLDFDKDTQIVIGYPNDTAPPGWYRRTQQTKFVLGVPWNRYPPNPCARLANVWNLFVRLDETVNKPDTTPVMSFAPVFNVLLEQMSENQCNTNIVRDTNTSPSDIIEIKPTP